MFVVTATRPPPLLLADSLTVALFSTLNATFFSELISEFSIFVVVEVSNVVCIASELTATIPPAPSEDITSNELSDLLLIVQLFIPFEVSDLKFLIVRADVPVNLFVTSGSFTATIIAPLPDDLLTLEYLDVFIFNLASLTLKFPPRYPVVFAVNSV